MNDIELETKEMNRRVVYFFVFFILSIAAGITCIRYPYMLGTALVALSFLFFNGVMLLYKAITFGMRRIIGRKR